MCEVVGNVFGFVSVLGGMWCKVWVWLVGIIGNVLLLMVFLGLVLSFDLLLLYLLG